MVSILSMNDKLAIIIFYSTNTPSKSIWVILLIITIFSTVHFFLLNGDMELNKNRQIFVNKML